MNNFTTMFYESLVKENYNFELAAKNVIRDVLEQTINELLRDELTSVLKYERYEHARVGNYRNGYYQRDFHTSFGTLHLQIPRDRNNEFDSPLVPKYERHDSTTEETILKLFNTGLTNSEITTIIESLYSKKYSKTTVSNITESFMVKVEDFKKRILQEQYAVVYLDATFIPLRRDTVQKEGLFIALGIRTNGNKEVLAYKIAPTESVEVWSEMLQELKDRGVKSVNLFCTDGLNGMPDAIHQVYPRAKIQRCLLHVLRNINQKVRVKDRAEVSTDFKALFHASSKDEGTKILEEFVNKWKGRYPKVKETIDKNEFLITFLDYPEAIRSSIYNTNMIESFNKQIKRKTNRKEQFPTEDAMEKFIVAIFEEFNGKFLNRVHKGFNQVQGSFWNEN